MNSQHFSVRVSPRNPTGIPRDKSTQITLLSSQARHRLPPGPRVPRSCSAIHTLEGSPGASLPLPASRQAGSPKLPAGPPAPPPAPSHGHRRTPCNITLHGKAVMGTGTDGCEPGSSPLASRLLPEVFAEEFGAADSGCWCRKGQTRRMWTPRKRGLVGCARTRGRTRI